MNDAEFLQKFLDTTLPASEFKHQAHICLAWLFLTKHNYEEASQLIIQSIKNYASAMGASQKYHETLTRAWIQLVNEAIAAHPKAENFSQFIGHAQELLSKDAPLRLYSQQLLDSECARYEWLPADIQ